jgi:hypothetical protein
MLARGHSASRLEEVGHGGEAPQVEGIHAHALVPGPSSVSALDSREAMFDGYAEAKPLSSSGISGVLSKLCEQFFLWMDVERTAGLRCRASFAQLTRSAALLSEGRSSRRRRVVKCAA